jgi:hypothetical protein
MVANIRSSQERTGCQMEAPTAVLPTSGNLLPLGLWSDQAGVVLKPISWSRLVLGVEDFSVTASFRFKPHSRSLVTALRNFSRVHFAAGGKR